MYNMSSRSRGRGGGRGFSRGGIGSRGGGNREYYRGQGRPSSGSRAAHDPDRLLSALGPEAKIALTQALVATVLSSDSRNGFSSSYREGREGNYRNYREGRGGYKEDYHPREQQRRHFGDDHSRAYHQHPRYEGGRSYREEERGRGRPRYDRDGRPPMGAFRQRTNYHKYVGPSKRRSSPHDHPGSGNKRQRPEESDARDSPRRENENAADDEKRASTKEEGEKKDLSGASEGGTNAGPSGVQVTIRADGERAVNSEGHVRSRVAGRLYVELRCPHCPNQRSITFKEYKYHLASDSHKNQLNNLARKHSLVLRKIRVQQRQEQKDIEAKWREEKPEEFKNAVTRFCNTCKLAFKYMGYMNDGSSLHNRSKLHRIQRHYLHPRCGMCRITFPTRMVYEHHMSSIKHLRAFAAMLDRKGGAQQDGQKSQDDNEDEDLDLENFMTLDSVGEDDDEVGSEHEEITGGLDVAEIAEDDSAVGDQDEDEEVGTPRKQGDVSLAWEKLMPEEDEEEENEYQQPLGTEYVRRVEAYFCNLCHKIIRGDSSHGTRAIRKHCCSITHVSQYKELHPPQEEAQSEGEAEGNGEGEESGNEVEAEDQDQKKEEEKKKEGNEDEAVTKKEEKNEEVKDKKKEEEPEEEEEEEEEKKKKKKLEEEEEEKKKKKKKLEEEEEEEAKRKAKQGEKAGAVEVAKEGDNDGKEDDMGDEKEEGWDEVGDDFTAP